MADIDIAKEKLREGYTCVLVKGEEILYSSKSGISPMLDYISSGAQLCGFSAADKIVGKAAAMLFSKAGIREVFAEVMSIQGRDWLEAKGIECCWDILVERIINRSGDDICPMEKTVRDIDDEQTAFEALLDTRARLMNPGSGQF